MPSIRNKAGSFCRIVARSRVTPGSSQKTVPRTREGEGAGVKPTAAMHGAPRFTIGWLVTPRLSVREKLRFVRSGDHREVDPNMDAILADRS